MKARVIDPRIPKSREQRRAEYAGLNAEERQELSEAAQARAHKQLSDSRVRAKKRVADAKARRLANIERGYKDEPESEEKSDGGKV